MPIGPGLDELRPVLLLLLSLVLVVVVLSSCLQAGPGQLARAGAVHCAAERTAAAAAAEPAAAVTAGDTVGLAVFPCVMQRRRPAHFGLFAIGCAMAV